MSILKYFNRTTTIVQDQRLPEPTSSLVWVILCHPRQLNQIKNKGPRGAGSAPHLILTPTQRFQVGKRAAEHGVTAWLTVTDSIQSMAHVRAYVTNWSRGVNVHYVLQNMFSEIFSLEEFHNSPNFLPPMCCSCNEFTKFSHCQSFPPYSIVGNILLHFAYMALKRTATAFCKRWEPL